MKEKVIKVKENNNKSKEIKVVFESEYFKCSSCGYTVRIKAIGDTATCSQCGGRMYRC